MRTRLAWHDLACTCSWQRLGLPHNKLAGGDVDALLASRGGHQQAPICSGGRRAAAGEATLVPARDGGMR